MMSTQSSRTPSTAPVVSHAALDNTLEYLKAHDDTSRFVGLALLKSLLDNDESLRANPEVISKCWSAVSAKFLDRLLRAPESKHKRSDETKSMVELAVAVIHAFTMLLKAEAGEDEKLVGRMDGLLAALLWSSSDSTIQILQILLRLMNGTKGTSVLLRATDSSALFEIAPVEPLALEVLKHAVFSVAARPELHPLLQGKLNDVISGLIVCFKDSNTHPLLEFLASLVPNMSPSVVEMEPSWLRAVAKLIQTSIMSQPTPAVRRAGSMLSAALLQTYPLTFPPLLFKNLSSSQSSGSKPFLYFFLGMISVDLRSSFPSLLELLASPEYPEISQRLTADFDILSAFIGFLSQSFEEEETGVTLPLAPDLLLKLRKELAETSSLTVEFLRDRWDAAVSGAAGLHPSIRPGQAVPVSSSTPLSLTWDDKEGGVVKDPLTLAAMRYLALWLREDDSEMLRSEAAGVLDVLLGLYDYKDEEGKIKGFDESTFKSPVLIAFEGILTTDDGVDAFLREDGWTVLSKDLCDDVLPHALNANSTSSSAFTLRRGIEIVRVFVTVVEHESSKGTREGWMSMLKTAAVALPTTRKEESAMKLELRVSLYQLAAALLAHAPIGMQSRYATEANRVRDECKTVARVFDASREHADSVEGALEVMNWLEELGIGARE